MKPQISFIKKWLFCIYIFFFCAFFFVPRTHASTGILKQINFQGKVVNKTVGTNVANGNYDFTFKLYDAASGGSLIWTETRTGGNQVAVTDGIFQVSLGSVQALPGSVDFNTDNLYLDITFNGETMTSRVRFTAVPYAFNALKVAGLTVTDTTGTFTLTAGKTLSVANSLSFAGTDGTTITFQGTDTYVGLATTDVLINKTIGSTGLLFSGASTDIDTAAAEGLVLQGRAASSFNTTAGAISFQAAGTGTISTVQVGAGGAGSTTPDFLGLDVKSDTGDPAGGFEGAMYYNTFDNKFRCYQGSAWADCIGTGGAGPWTDSGTTSYLTDTTDELVLGGSSPLSSAKFSIDGDADQIQFILQGNATQTTSLAVFENSSGTDQFTFSNTGALGIEGAISDITGATVDISDNLDVSGTLFAGTGDAFQVDASGTITAVGATLSGALDANGDVSIADTNIALDGASTTLTATGALTLTPGGAMILGASTQSALVRGTTVGLTSTSAGNDITFTSADDYFFAAGAGSALDYTAAASTVTTGVIDLNIDTSVTGGFSSINNGLTVNATAATGDDYFADDITLTNNDTDANAFGIRIVGAATANAGANAYETGLWIDNQEDTSGSMGSAIKVTATTNAALTTALDVSDAEIVNALLAGANDLSGTNWSITGSTGAFDTQSTIQAGSGNITITDSTGNILESAIADGSVYSRLGAAETITGGWTFNTAATIFTTALNANGGLTTSTTNTALTLGANGSGDIVFSNDADTNVQITAGAASGVDLLAVSTNGNNVTTTGVDGVQIDFSNNSSSAIDNAGLRINMTSNNTNASTTLEAIAIGTLSSPQAGNEYALTIGSGWDRGLSVDSASMFTAALTSTATTVIGSSGNTFTFNPASGPVYAGTARPTKRITLTPEYAGATFTADGSNNTVTMTSDNMTTTPYRNYYKIANSAVSAQDYDIWVKVPLPADFAAMAATPTLSIDTYSSDKTNGTILVTVYDTSNSADCTSAAFTPTVDATWQTKTQTTCLDTGTYTANGVMTIDIKVAAAATSGDTRLGMISFDYLAQF